jgi:hypothetical protein
MQMRLHNVADLRHANHTSKGIVLSNVTFNDRGNVRPVSTFTIEVFDRRHMTDQYAGFLAYFSCGDGRPLRKP